MLQELIGPSHEISAIEGSLEACPVLLLHGPGGIWKSALFRYLAWWWKASSVADHIIYVDFETPAGKSFIGADSPAAKESHLFIYSLLVDSEIPNALNIVTSFFA
jgi:hypothetical protein